jgi:hypothetical protein
MLKNKIGLSEYYDHLKVEMELKLLHSMGYLNLKDAKWELTEDGEQVIDELDKQISFISNGVSGQILGSQYSVMIDSYREIFPNIKLPSGKYARQNVKNLENGFKWFFKTYPDYNWDIVLKATTMYVEEYSMRSYEFMRTSQFFIRKQASDKSWDSELATYCDMILNGEDSIPRVITDKVV